MQRAQRGLEWAGNIVLSAGQFALYYYSPYGICVVNMLMNFIINTKTSSRLRSLLSDEKVQLNTT